MEELWCTADFPEALPAFLYAYRCEDTEGDEPSSLDTPLTADISWSR
jgi:hypothetical protein